VERSGGDVLFCLITEGKLGIRSYHIFVKGMVNMKRNFPPLRTLRCVEAIPRRLEGKGILGYDGSRVYDSMMEKRISK
jgi:hypothetical protein